MWAHSAASLNNNAALTVIVVDVPVSLSSHTHLFLHWLVWDTVPAPPHRSCTLHNVLCLQHCPHSQSLPPEPAEKQPLADMKHHQEFYLWHCDVNVKQHNDYWWNLQYLFGVKQSENIFVMIKAFSQFWLFSCNSKFISHSSVFVLQFSEEINNWGINSQLPFFILWRKQNCDIL